MKQIKRTFIFTSVLLVPLLLCCACQSLYRGTVTLTGIVDTASKEYARAYNDGLVPSDLAVKVSNAHLQYRKSAGVAQQALIAYKASGDPASYKTALDSARSAALLFVDFIVPLLRPDQVNQFRTQIQKASAP